MRSTRISAQRIQRRGRHCVGRPAAVSIVLPDLHCFALSWLPRGELVRVCVVLA
jgi:hypothetical protein